MKKSHGKKLKKTSRKIKRANSVVGKGHRRVSSSTFSGGSSVKEWQE